jgi:hypothetical protein
LCGGWVGRGGGRGQTRVMGPGAGGMASLLLAALFCTTGLNTTAAEPAARSSRVSGRCNALGGFGGFTLVMGLVLVAWLHWC